MSSPSDITAIAEQAKDVMGDYLNYVSLAHDVSVRTEGADSAHSRQLDELFQKLRTEYGKVLDMDRPALDRALGEHLQNYRRMKEADPESALGKKFLNLVEKNL